MRIPYWDTTLTLYSRNIGADNRVEWESTVIADCFWRRKALRERNSGAEFALNGFICRIPGDAVSVNIGDIIVSGHITDQIDEYTAGMRSADLIQRYQGRCMTVSEVHYNAAPFAALKHFYAEGS